MKKTLLPLTLLLVGFAAASAQQYDIRLNLEPGLKVPLRTVNVSEQEVTIPNQGTQQQKVTMTNELVFSVIEKKGENYIINGIINKMEMVIEKDGKQTTLANAADTVENMYNKEMKAITGKVFKAEITPKFKLVGEATPLNNDMSPEDAKKAFKAFDDVYGNIYPEKPVALNETWTENDEEGMSVENKLSSVNDNSYIIEGKATLSMKESGMDIKGTGTMSQEIHRTTGVPISGLLTLPLSGSEPTPMGPVTLKFSSTMSFEYAE